MLLEIHFVRFPEKHPSNIWLRKLYNKIAIDWAFVCSQDARMGRF